MVKVFMEIGFDSEVALPMPGFGHSSHFGLGLFVPAEPSSDCQIDPGIHAIVIR